LRDLVRDDGQRRDHPQLGVDQEGGRNDHAITEVVDAVAHQHRQAAPPGLIGIKAVVVVVMVMLVVMAMPVQLGLFQQEKEHQTTQQGQEQGIWPYPGAERLRQHVQQGRAQQDTGGQADQVLDDQAQQRGRQGRSQHHGHDPTQEGRQQNVHKRHVRILTTVSSKRGMLPGIRAMRGQ